VTPRPHTGSRRNDQARSAILDAAQRLLRTEGYGALTIGAIAREAGVGRQTIYRWWPSKADVVLEALIAWGAEAVPTPAGGPLPQRLRAFVRATFSEAGDPGAAALLRALAGESQRDPEFGARFATFLAARRAALGDVLAPDVPAAQIPVVVDLVFGVLWYRLLLGHEPLDDRAADQVAALLARSF
jgi:AcrR family transcriptional regulator